jgi:four helix bundle protein
VEHLRDDIGLMRVKKGVGRFEDLIAWQKARSLVREVYRVIRRGEFETDYALRNQIRKAAISIPSNIAEGFERSRHAEFHQFLSIAKSSCAEVRTQIYLAYDAEYIDEATCQGLLQNAEEVGRIIGGLRAAVERRAQHSALSTQHSR